MKKDSGDLLRGILLAHLILFLHLLFIAGLGLVVIFFHGISQYMLWIFLGATVILFASGFFCYRHIKTQGKQTLKDIEESAIFKNRSFEVRLLGGMASLRFGRPDAPKEIENAVGETHHPRYQLEDPETLQIRELTALADMLEKNLITAEEFSRAKQKIMHPRQREDHF
ncbi:MAG: hypothetical protein PVG96_20240 [Desulfobacterales bacterium]|jgi:hypothetical protein